MSRIVTNKHLNGRDPVTQDFYSGINVDSYEERKRIAMGRVILTIGQGQEAIWMLNENNLPRLVAQPIDVEIPPEIREYISSAITSTIEVVEDYADAVVVNKINEFSMLVVSSADTMYNALMGYINTLSASTEFVTNEIDSRLTNEIKGERSRIDELSAYTMNLKLSDHFMLTDDEYRMLSFLGELVVDDEGEFVSKTTRELNDLNFGDVIIYNDEIYYCIYDENGGGGESGSTPTISGTTMEIQYIVSGGTIILDDYVIVDGHTLIFPDDGHSGSAEISGSTIEDDAVYIDSENEHTLVLGENYEYDEENNTFIIN